MSNQKCHNFLISILVPEIAHFTFNTESKSWKSPLKGKKLNICLYIWKTTLALTLNKLKNVSQVILNQKYFAHSAMCVVH